MNLKDYIRKQTNNILFESNYTEFFISVNSSNKRQYLLFDEIYKLYNEFKKLGKNIYLSQDKTINRIEINDDELDLKWPLTDSNSITSKSDEYLTCFLDTEYVLNDKDIGLKQEKRIDIVNFSELVYLLSDSIRSFCELEEHDIKGHEKASKKMARIVKITENEIEQAFQSFDLNKVPQIIRGIVKLYPSLSKITEELRYNDDYEAIEPYIKYKNITAVLFHFFKLEIVYYSFIVVKERKKSTLCPVCGKYNIGKCKCMNVSASFRRNQNKKCALERKKLARYVDMYSDIISNEYLFKANRMLEEAEEHNNHWQDLAELRRLRYGIEAQIKETK